MKNLLKQTAPILIALIIALGLIQFKSCERQENLAQANKALLDSLHHSHDKYGNLVTSTAVIELENKAFRKELLTKDSTIKELQKTAKKYKKDLYEATLITISTKEQGEVADIEVTPKDTSVKNGQIYLYPEYHKSIVQPWGFKMDVTMNKDQMTYNIEMLNRMQFITRYQRRRLVAAKEPVIDVITYNPNTGVQELKTYIPKQPKRHTGAKVAGGVALGVVIGLLIHR